MKRKFLLILTFMLLNCCLVHAADELGKIKFISSNTTYELFNLDGTKINGDYIIRDQNPRILIRTYERNAITEVTATSITAGARIPVLTFGEKGNEKIIEIPDASGDISLQVFLNAKLPSITAQPQTIKVPIGSSVTLSLTAANAEKYEWKYREAGDELWTCNLATTPTLKVEANRVTDNYEYMCTVSNNYGQTNSNIVRVISGYNSDNFTLPQIKTQFHDIKTSIGTPITLKVEALNADSYSWKYRKIGDEMWACDISKTDTLKITADTLINNYEFVCSASNKNGEVHSNIFRIISCYKDSIIAYYKMDIGAINSVKVPIGQVAKFKINVEADARAITYTWQYRKNENDKFENVTSSLGTGYNTNELSINTASMELNPETLETTNDLSGYQFRCLVSNGTITKTSNVALLQVAQDNVSVTFTKPNYTDGRKVYMTLSEALTYAENNSIISPLQNITDNSDAVLPEGKTLTINAETYTITKENSSITNNGTLNIKGNIIGQNNASKALIINNGELNISKGSIKNNAEAIRNLSGTTNINNELIESTSSNAIYNKATATLIIGEKGHGVNNEAPIIKSGTSSNYAIYNEGTLKFYDGALKGTNDAYYLSTSSILSLEDGKIVTKDNEVLDGATYKVAKLGTGNYRDNNGVGYITLSDALAGVQENGTIELLRDVEDSSVQTIDVGKKFTLNLNNYTLKTSGTLKLTSGNVQIIGSGKIK